LTLGNSYGLQKRLLVWRNSCRSGCWSGENAAEAAAGQEKQRETAAEAAAASEKELQMRLLVWRHSCSLSRTAGQDKKNTVTVKQRPRAAGQTPRRGQNIFI